MPSIFVSAANDPDLGIQEGGIYIWEVTSFDAEKYEEHIGSIAGTFLGMKTQYTVEYIYKGDWYWYCEMEIATYITTPQVNGYEYSTTIPTAGENYSVVSASVFIPKDVPTFFGNWTPSTNYTVIELGVKYSNNFTLVDKIYTYRSDGILSSLVYTYDGATIFSWNLISSTISLGNYFIVFSIIAISGIILLTTKRIKRGRLE